MDGAARHPQIADLLRHRVEAVRRFAADTAARRLHPTKNRPLPGGLAVTGKNF
jgi:hypothetical protein